MHSDLFDIIFDLQPLSRMLCVGSGFAITKADIFPAVAARGAGQIALVS
jgi:auxin efflux carrier family protein